MLSPSVTVGVVICIRDFIANLREFVLIIERRPNAFYINSVAKTKNSRMKFNFLFEMFS